MYRVTSHVDGSVPSTRSVPPYTLKAPVNAGVPETIKSPPDSW